MLFVLQIVLVGDIFTIRVINRQIRLKRGLLRHVSEEQSGKDVQK